MTKEQHKRKMQLRRIEQFNRVSSVWRKSGKYPGYKLREINAIKGV